MKFLIHSNAPSVKTGYGVQCAHLVTRLQDAGHDVAVSCTYGQQGAAGDWRGTRLYPTGYEVNGNDIIHNHALHWFEGDIKGGWVIPILDVWCLVNPLLEEFNVAAWAPVDHYPVPPDVVKFFHRTNAIPIAMSRFGETLFAEAGLDPVYIPLSVDTKAYRPTRMINIEGRGEVTGRQYLGISDNAFLVGMVAMNKGWARDRKGFNEAFRAFGLFHQKHPDAVLYVHADWPGGAEGINLKELAVHAQVPEHAIVFPDQYAYRFGFEPDQMAAVYSAFDVLLSPSHGEGFCVPLIEAQACGTPVIATAFSAQLELASPEFGAAGWVVGGQMEWDPAQHASYVVPFIDDIVDKLEEAYRSDLAAMVPTAVEFAAGYDTDAIFNGYWAPFLESLEPPPVLELEQMPGENGVAVVVPAMRRPQNVARLVESLAKTAPHCRAYFVCDPDDHEEQAAVIDAGAMLLLSDKGESYAAKANVGYESTPEPWVLVVGDDVQFHPGWYEALRAASRHGDVVGTNDSLPGRVRNPDVAAGRHADHFAVRRSYIDAIGASLDGPGILAPECYRHWWVDKEIVELAKARGLFVPCLDAVVEHHHPGYDGKERDDVYMVAVDAAEADQKLWLERLPLIQMQRVSRVG